MKALVYHGPGRKAWEEVPMPTMVADADAIVRVDTVTICGTDLHILKGDVPEVTDGRILGHEAVGTVEQVGTAVKNVKPGDRVHHDDLGVEGRGVGGAPLDSPSRRIGSVNSDNDFHEPVTSFGGPAPRRWIARPPTATLPGRTRAVKRLAAVSVCFVRPPNRAVRPGRPGPPRRAIGKERSSGL